MSVHRSGRGQNRGRIRLPEARSMCFRCGEFHVMEPECWEWAFLMTLKRPYLGDQELGNYQQEIAERRILDRWARTGAI
jgi:hypothetical protein